MTTRYRSEGPDPRIPPSIGDIVTLSIQPRWWVRAMSAVAHALWKCQTAPWAIADLCLWLQKKTRKRVA